MALDRTETTNLRAKLRNLYSKAEHLAILRKHGKDYKAAAEEYTALGRAEVSRQLARFWSLLYLADRPSKALEELKSRRRYIPALPDDDIGDTAIIPDVAERILVIPDMHLPYHHPDSLAFLYSLQSMLKPDLVVQLGDLLDKHALSFHESDPDLHSAGAELERSRETLEALHSVFPVMLKCHSNHGSLVYRRAKAHGIPVAYIKRYREVLFPEHGAPGWSWSYAWRINTPQGVFMFKHQASGDALQDAAHNVCNLVVGHEHGKFGTSYAASSAHLYSATYAGCLIDKDSLAFAYGKHTLRKPVLGAVIILHGIPIQVPMLLDDSGRWDPKSMQNLKFPS